MQPVFRLRTFSPGRGRSRVHVPVAGEGDAVRAGWHHALMAAKRRTRAPEQDQEDVNQIVFRILQEAMGEAPKRPSQPTRKSAAEAVQPTRRAGKR